MTNEVIKNLENAIKTATNEDVKKSLKSKIDAIKKGKAINK